MALPTITSNSPAAGSIAWTAFAIQYNGVSYSVAAGNTTNKYTWWVYNGGAPVLNGSNTLPDIGPDDLLLFLNKAGIGVLVPTMDVYDGSLIINGSILAASIGADQINGTHIIANAITSDEIAANAVTASEILAGAVTTEKLSVGSVGNSLVTNGSFEEFDGAGMPLGWKAAGATNGTISIVTGIASSGTNALQFSATGSTSNLSLIQTPEKYIPVSATAGRKWYLSMRAGAGTATTNGAYLRANWYDANKTYISYNDAVTNAALGTTWTVFEGQVTPPATARYMGVIMYLASPNVATNMYIDEVIAREVIISAQIGDGQITAPKLVANSITANYIAGGTITADKLLVSDRTNFWENPDFEGDTVGGIPRGTTLTNTTNARVLGAGATGSAKSMELNALSGSNNDVFSTNIFPVEPGDQYWVAFDYKFLNAAGTASAGVGFRTYGPTMAGITWTGVKTTGSARPTTWQENTTPGIYTVPAGTYYLQPWVTFSNNAETTNRFHVDNIVIRRISGGELIVDGAIIASKIATDAITSTKILANAVVAGKIGANAVTAYTVAANAIQANHIAAGQIQAGHILAGAIDGQVITGGELRTTQGAGQIAARMGPSTTFDPTGNTVRPGIGFTVAGNTDNPAGMFSPTGTDLQLVQGGAGTAGNLAYMSLGSNNAKLYGWNTTTVTGRSGLTMDGQVGPVTISGNQIDLRPANGLLLNGKDFSAGEVQVWDAAGSIPNYTIPVVHWSGYVANNTLSTSTALGTINAGGDLITVQQTGVYDIHASYGQNGGGVADSRQFIEISTSGQDKLLARAAFSNIEDSVSCTATGVKINAGETIKVDVLQNSGGTRTYTARLRLKRVAAPVPVTAWGNGSQSITGDMTAGGKISATGAVTGKIRHYEGYNSSFSVAANAQWDSGPVTTDGANSTDTAMCSPHNVPGAIMINETGWYMVTLYLTPASDPGQGHTHLNYVSGSSNNLISRFATVPNGPNTYETFLSTGPVLLTAGNYIRSELLYSIGHNVNSRWRIHKVEN